MEAFADTLGENAHDEFKRWEERNELEGYVISRRSRNNAMLHRADCRHLTDDYGPGAVISPTAKPKICSTDKRELENWARENMDRELKRCRSCM